MYLWFSSFNYLQILHKKGAYATIITGIFSFFFVSVTRTRISLRRLVDKTSNYAAFDVLHSRPKRKRVAAI